MFNLEPLMLCFLLVIFLAGELQLRLQRRPLCFKLRVLDFKLRHPRPCEGKLFSQHRGA